MLREASGAITRVWADRCASSMASLDPRRVCRCSAPQPEVGQSQPGYVTARFRWSRRSDAHVEGLRTRFRTLPGVLALEGLRK